MLSKVTEDNKRVNMRKLILSGKLPAIKVGRDHVIQKSDLVLVSVRKRGRPFEPNDQSSVAVKATAKSRKVRKKQSDLSPKSSPSQDLSKRSV
jgi:hypothetical protein